MHPSNSDQSARIAAKRAQILEEHYRLKPWERPRVKVPVEIPPESPIQPPRAAKKKAALPEEAA